MHGRTGGDLEQEVAVDLGDESPPSDESILHLEAIDPQGDIVDVHEMDAEGCREASLAWLVRLVGRLGDEGQVALDALQIQILKVPPLTHAGSSSS